MDYPTPPPLGPMVPGQAITAGAFNALGSASRRQRIVGGRGIMVREAGPDGVVIEVDLAASKSAGAPKPCYCLARITGGEAPVYNARIYPDGPNNESTAYNGTVYAMGVGWESSVSGDVWVVAHEFDGYRVGGSE